MEDNKNQEEVDMVSIVKETSCFCFKKIGALLTCILRLTYRYILVLAAIWAIAIVISAYLTTGDRKTYEGNLCLKLNAGTSYMVSDMMKELNKFIKTNDSKGLAEALKLKEEEAKELSFIDTYYYIAINNDSTRAIIDYCNHYDIEDTTNTVIKDKIVITVGIKERSLFNKMQETLTNFINDNAYLKELHDNKLSDLYEREAVIECDLKRLDSLQKKQFFTNSKNEIYLTNFTELHSGRQDLFYTDKQNLLDKKASLETDLTANQKPATILNPIHPTAVSHISFLKMSAKACGIAYLLFLIISAIIKNKKSIHAYLSQE